MYLIIVKVVTSHSVKCELKNSISTTYYLEHFPRVFFILSSLGAPKNVLEAQCDSQLQNN